MGTQHTVADGEHLSAIAEKHGFHDVATIWDHADNAALKKKRVDPHVLHPGDVVVIPDKLLRKDARPTDRVHRFRRLSKPLKLRIALKDFDNQPLAGVKCELTVAGKVHQLTSDGDGVIEAPVPRSATDGLLKVPEIGLEQTLKIGFLDPLDEDSGWQARLVNLGYYPGAVLDDDAEQMRHAIEEFQCDHQLTVNGELDAATRAKLKQEHGA